MTTATTPSPFIAWYRQGRGDRWEQLAEDDENACWNAVQAAGGRSGGDFAVLAVGVDPNAKRRGYAAGGRRQF